MQANIDTGYKKTVGSTRWRTCTASLALRHSLADSHPTRKGFVHTLGYSQADADSGKSTVEDQLHEAEANKNASAFVKA